MTTDRPVYRFNRALCRRPAGSVAAGLRAIDRGNPSPAVIAAEHDAYVAALRDAGIAVDLLDPEDAFPDSMFVEDPALVFSEGAVLLRPGAASRAGEVDALAPALQARFPTVLSLPNGTVDGGDVLTTPQVVMIGLSARTSRAGADALVACLSTLGRRAVIVDTPSDVLHFKSDCSLLDQETVLTTARLAASGVFHALRTLVVPDGEEAGANALRVNDVVLVGRPYRGTIALLQRQGYDTVPLSLSEVGKLDGGLSCLSLRWHEDGRSNHA